MHQSPMNGSKPVNAAAFSSGRPRALAGRARSFGRWPTRISVVIGAADAGRNSSLPCSSRMTSTIQIKTRPVLHPHSKLMRELRDREEVCEANPKYRANKSNYPLRDCVRDSEQNIIGESRPPIEPVEPKLRIVEDL